ncbi:asparaginase [Qingshengfaniella alkalisoli]|uniref:Asparaginase n=1 Tax=Qingshengfaniella alkalisoli TaxID=2599296 RepID=A0A5B8IWV5_9RHOB|nr:asparaginase [Qingshengfaniella alkalisoli]QDY70063.1 asparaginase [Qingshengfaniella alkalisoli]
MNGVNDGSVPLVEVWRGAFLESVHRGHAVICDEFGQIVDSWGNPDAVILPRSSCKMIQALPLVESGAARKYGLGSEHLALACASHEGAAIHTERVTRWLHDLGKDVQALRCGPQMPADREAKKALICGGHDPDDRFNNCSGKHCGFVTLADHLDADGDYNEASHPVQVAIRQAFEDVTGEASPGFAVDGCSAPNFATTMLGLARAMASFAAPGDGIRGEAQRDLVSAMRRHPDLIAGEGRACTELIRAGHRRFVVKTGADGVYTGILPDQKLGIAIKIEDGASRGSEAVIAALLARTGSVDRDHPAVRARLNRPILTRLGAQTGELCPVEGLLS